MSNNSSANPYVERLVREEIQELSAYHVPPAGDANLVKLDAMENPYTWSDAMKAECSDWLSSASINRYPDPQALQVQKSLREAMQIPEHLDIMFGNGSDELIQVMAMALAKPGSVMFSLEPSFVMYRMIAKYTHMRYRSVDLKADFSIDIDTTLAAIREHQPALTFLAQPNNPTGNVFSVDDVRAIVECSEGLVVIDEAYKAFTDRDHIDFLDQYDNVVIMRTVSKIGLAGLRLGFLVGSRDWISEFNKVRLPYNINILTQISADYALQHYDSLLEQTQRLREDREALYESLKQRNLGTVWRSETNFILCRTQDGAARTVFEKLRERNILIKCLDGVHPLLRDCLRITVGTQEENAKVLNALDDVL